jgi:DtxR family Mn-dependent transcriptional regulator
MEQRLSSSIEDYIETIYIYSQEKPGVRLTDLAKGMGVSKPSANDAVKKLKDLGYVTHDKYQPIYLTDKGRAKAREVFDKHMTLTDFLVDVLGVTPKVAEQDACCIEHIISEETFQKLKKYITEQKKEGH